MIGRASTAKPLFGGKSAEPIVAMAVLSIIGRITTAKSPIMGKASRTNSSNGGVVDNWKGNQCKNPYPGEIQQN